MTKYARDTNPDEFLVYFLAQNPTLSKDRKDYYSAVCSNLSNIVVEEQVVAELLQSVAQREALTKLAVAAYEASEGRGSLEAVASLRTLLDQSSGSFDVSAQTFVTDDLEEIYVKAVKEPGLRWRLKSLNTSLGSLRKGDFGFVFARPETGKTTFLASECTYMASQATSPVLWFNNEEQGEKVMLRCYQAALGATLEQLFSSIGEARERFRSITKGNLKLVDQASLDKGEVESLCDKIKPSLIIFDQIDKVGGFNEDRDDLKLGAIYQWARELAKIHCPVIGVCQADGSAEGVKWLTMAHVSNAKTSKQAEADWILGIGRSNDAGYEMVRHFNISKNKLVGDPDTIPDRRHDRWDVLIEPLTARYRDIL